MVRSAAAAALARSVAAVPVATIAGITGSQLATAVKGRARNTLITEVTRPVSPTNAAVITGFPAASR